MVDRLVVLVGWLVVGWSVGLVGCSGWLLVGWSIGCSCWLIRLVILVGHCGWSFWLVILVGWLVNGSVGWSIGRLFGQLVVGSSR